jgi:hypothetical protein
VCKGGSEVGSGDSSLTPLPSCHRNRFSLTFPTQAILCACGPRLLGYGGRTLAQPQSQVRGGAELCESQHGVAVVGVEMRVTPPAAASVVVGRIHIVAFILLSLLAVL